MVANVKLRENARMQLDNSPFKNKWLKMLVVCAMVSLASVVATSVFYGIGFIAVFIVTGPLMYGVCRTTVECVEGKQWEIGHVFCGFKEKFGVSFLLYLLQSLFTMLWTLLFIIPGIVKSYSYALAFYIQQEGEEMEAVDCITKSRQMMNGHKWQLFCLDFSFIGWYIVGALCLGIGIYFVTPYHEMARANFYEAVKAEFEQANFSAPSVAEEQPLLEESKENDEPTVTE